MPSVPATGGLMDQFRAAKNKFEVLQNFTGTGVVGAPTSAPYDVRGHNTIRVAVEGVGGGNVIKVYGKIRHQTNWTLLETITGTSDGVSISCSVADEVYFNCDTYSASGVPALIASGFFLSGGASNAPQISGTPAANQVAYWSSSSELTGDSGFTYTPASGIISFRKDRNGVTVLQVRNDDTGVSAAAVLKLSSDIDDFNLLANGSGAGAVAQLTSNSGFTNGLQLNQLGSRPISMLTNSVSRLNISGAGVITMGLSLSELMLGGTAAMAQVGNATSGNLSATTAYGLLVDPTAPSTTTVLYGVVSGKLQTPNSSFTLPIGASFYGQAASKGAASTITRLLHFYGAVPTDGGTGNAWGSDNATYSGSWVFHFTSTSPSHFAGNLEIVKAGSPNITLQDSNGLIGTNAAPSISFKDSTNTIAGMGFLASTDTVFTFRNYSSVGSFQWTINSTVRGSIDQNGKWTIGESSGTQFHKVNGRGIQVAYGASGVTGYFELDHSSNTSGSGACVYLSVAGANAFDPFLALAISSVIDWTLGIDNSDSDAFVISNSSALGSSNALRITPTTLQCLFGGTGGVVVRNDQNAATTTQIRNDNTGASAFAQLKVSSALGDAVLNVNSSAAGASVQLSVDSAFTSGFDISILGTNVLRLKTNGTNRVVITGAGSVVIGGVGTQISTSATDGFLYIPSCAGTPSGAPTAQAGTVAMVYDTNNNKLYVYNSAWNGVVLS